MKDIRAWHVNGFFALLACLASLAGSIALLIVGGNKPAPSGGMITLGILLILLFFVAITSMTIVQPNQAKVITFFGRYIGTVAKAGLWMCSLSPPRRRYR